MTAENYFVTAAHFSSHLRLDKGFPKDTKRALLSFFPIADNKMLKKHGFSKLSFFEKETFFNEESRTLYLQNIGFGAPKAAFLIELLASLGVREFLFIGATGSLREDLKLGELVQVTSALCDEGTSLHYGAERFELINTPYRSTLMGDCKEVRTWTTDAIFRESTSKRKNAVALKCDVVEMEASAIFSVGKTVGVKTSLYALISDELKEDVWHPGFFDKGYSDGYKKATELLLSL